MPGSGMLTMIGHVATAALAAGNGTSGAALGPGPTCHWPIHSGLIITQGVSFGESTLGDAAGCCQVAGTKRGLRGWTWNPPAADAKRGVLGSMFCSITDDSICTWGKSRRRE